MQEFFPALVTFFLELSDLLPIFIYFLFSIKRAYMDIYLQVEIPLRVYRTHVFNGSFSLTSPSKALRGGIRFCLVSFGAHTEHAVLKCVEQILPFADAVCASAP